MVLDAPSGGNPTLESGAEMKSKIVIYGAGMAGAILASRLAEDLDVTVVAPTDYFEVPMAMPRLMVQPGFADKAIVPITEALPKAQHIRGRLDELIGAGGVAGGGGGGGPSVAAGLHVGG